MNCNYCQKAPTLHSSHYRISNVKERFIPTYSHVQIFGDQEGDCSHVRCTPTFHSTALNVEGYQPRTNQQLKGTKQKSNEGKTAYRNDSKDKRQVELNPGIVGCCAQNNGQWYDPAKEELFESLKGCTKYSRERKMADLSSNPVFGGIIMEPAQNVAQSTNERLKPVEKEQEPESVEEYPQQVEHNEPLAESQLPNVAIPAAESKKEEKKSSSSVRPVSACSTGKPAAQVKQADKKKAAPKYVLNHDVTLCTRGCSAGKKMAKAMVLGSQQPAYTIFRGKKK